MRGRSGGVVGAGALVLILSNPTTPCPGRLPRSMATVGPWSTPDLSRVTTMMGYTGKVVRLACRAHSTTACTHPTPGTLSVASQQVHFAGGPTAGFPRSARRRLTSHACPLPTPHVPGAAGHRRSHAARPSSRLHMHGGACVLSGPSVLLDTGLCGHPCKPPCCYFRVVSV